MFVLGDVEEPGSYAVTGLSTMTNALMESGAVTEIGSLRDIQLKRNGETVTTLDLYDLLLSGDTSGDARLQPGDVIFVPPIGGTVSISGAVKRPAIYELRGGESIAVSIGLAGGLNADADASRVKLERIVSGRGITVHQLDLGDEESAAALTRDGDIIEVPPNLELLENVVSLETRPGWPPTSRRSCWPCCWAARGMRRMPPIGRTPSSSRTMRQSASISPSLRVEEQPSIQRARRFSAAARRGGGREGCGL